MTMRRIIADLAVVASAILAPAAAASLISTTTLAGGTAVIVGADADGQSQVVRAEADKPWWIDGAAITVAFTAATAGVGVVGARLLELWKQYNEIRAGSVLSKLDEAQHRLADRDAQIAFLTDANHQLRQIVANQLADMLGHSGDVPTPKPRPPRPRPKPEPAEE
jgi:hypothetical protein